MGDIKNTFNKYEKLKSKKQLDEIFTKGKSFLVFPIKVMYSCEKVEKPLPNNIKIGVGVSKRNFKKATDRNRVKRLLREAYRLNKQVITANNNCNVELNVFLMFIDKQLPQLSLLQPKMIKILEKLLIIVNEKNTNSIELPINRDS